MLGVLFLLVLGAAAASATSYTLTVAVNGTGSGTVTSNPAAITCKPMCAASFASGTKVKLTAKPTTGSYLVAWTGACKGTSLTCTVTLNSNVSVTATFNVNQTVKVLNHIIFMAQENRGLDHYWGALREYWR